MLSFLSIKMGFVDSAVREPISRAIAEQKEIPHEFEPFTGAIELESKRRLFPDQLGTLADEFLVVNQIPVAQFCQAIEAFSNHKKPFCLRSFNLFG